MRVLFPERFPLRRQALTAVMPPFVFCLLVAGLQGCGDDYWWGNGPGATAAVTTPSGVQTGEVAITYTLTGEVTEADISVAYSTDGKYFHAATEGSGGDGTRKLSVSPGGDVHTFTWDSGKDLSAERAPSVMLRIAPQDGMSDTTSAMQVHNLRFLAAVEDPSMSGSAGRVRMYSLDAVEGGIKFLQLVQTGGLDPYDILHDHGFFFVANETSNTISVFKLDETQKTIVAVGGSPFSAGAAKAKYLATDGSHLFVSGLGNTVSVLERDSQTGALNFRSSVSVDGCRGLATRSGHLYVAGETTGGISIFDVQPGGELLLNGYSPVTTGGLVSPRSLVVAGARIYAVNSTQAGICGFNILGGGSLSPVSGSPFVASGIASEQLASSSSKLLAPNGAGDRLLSFSVDPFGTVTEDSFSPLTLPGPSFSAMAAGNVVVAATTTAERLEIWTVDATGVLTPGASSPFEAGVGVIRMAVSD